MAGEWRVQTFAELVGGRNNIVGGPFGSNLTQADYTAAGVPVIRGSNMGQAGRYIGGEFAYVSTEKAARLISNQVDPGDIIVTQRGTMGQVSVVPPHPSIKYIVSQSQMGVRVRESDPMFVYYLLRSSLFRDFLEGATIQTGVPHINMGLLRGWKVATPELPSQLRIAELLGTIDDKIELNQRMAETLQEVARALFKSWFVDFDPIRAKAEGRPTGLPDEVAALFPNSLDESGLPEGWSSESVLDQSDWVNGAAYKDMHFSDASDALPVVKIAELKNGITRTTRYTNTDLGERFRIGTGELLFSWSGSPDTSIDAFIWVNDEAWLNQHIFAVRPVAGRTRAYLFAMLKYLKNELIEIARNKQTTGLGHVTRQDLARMQIQSGGPAVLAAFEARIVPIYERLQAALKEIYTLVTLRDTLIPNLISGKLRVGDVEKRIVAA